MDDTINAIAAYWDRRPCNLNHGTSAVGSLAWSRQVSKRKYFVEPHIPEFAQFRRWCAKRVLEIGCGIGTDTIEFLRVGAHVCAIDISDNSLRLARARVDLEFGKYSSVPNFWNFDAEEMLPCDHYDLIYSFGVLHHTPHPEKVLAQAYQLLREDGELRVMLYAKWSIKNLLREQPEAQAGCPLVKFYSAWEARKLLWSCGFKIVSIQKRHIFPWRVKDYIEHRYVKRLFWRIIPATWLERLLGCHLLIVATKA